MKRQVSPISLQYAHNFIEEKAAKLLYLPPVEKEAFYRLQKYPKQVSDSLHHALVLLPRRLAYILHEDETCISAAIEAFYLRDPISMRPLQDIKTTTLFFPPEDLVTAPVKFTKVGYAQLKNQHFSAPVAWNKIISDSCDSRLQARAQLGMKLACGFEMLMSDPHNKDKRQVREIALLLEDVETGQDNLPSDAEIMAWPQRDDDEGWLDISFDEFEKELAGRKDDEVPNGTSGFGDRVAQDNLRKMVGRFEDFLDDGKAGIEGAEVWNDAGSDGDDTDDDDASSQDSQNGPEENDVDFDERKFTIMMREMMGLPPTEAPTELAKVVDKCPDSPLETDFEELAINETTDAMEKELRDAGALHLDPGVQQGAKEFMQHVTADQSGDENEGDVDIDLNLAKNILESFKGQAGNSGPGGNLLGLMGMRMPRDDDHREPRD